MMAEQNKGARAGAEKAKAKGPVRYAVVGLGYFAQEAILPAFRNARNSRLAALVSDDPEKLKKLARKHGVDKTYSYAQYQECLDSGEIDAVFIALPNDLHREYAVRAARAGVHVLCEKPMAVTEGECKDMIREANEHAVRLMIAYRLHFEAGNLEAIDIVQSGKIGEPRFFHSVFSMQVQDDNIRTRRERGGGTLHDIGIYCINAARYLFREEPYEVFGYSSKTDDPRFREVDEMTSALLRFPAGRIASFTCSFGAADVSTFQIVGTQGDLRMDMAYEWTEAGRQELTILGKKKEKIFPRQDQAAQELFYFSDCVLKGKEPEPSGLEGLADVRILNAIYESANTGRPVRVEQVDKQARPSKDLDVGRRSPRKAPDLFHAQSPTRGG